MKDPYAQDKAELIAGKLLLQPDMPLSNPIQYHGRLDGVLETVRLLQHRCGFPLKAYQVKFNGEINVLRLSDYHTRHTAEPGDYFWLWGVVIMGGSIEDHRACDHISGWAQGRYADVSEDSMIAQHYAIVIALKRLREDANERLAEQHAP